MEIRLHVPLNIDARVALGRISDAYEVQSSCQIHDLALRRRGRKTRLHIIHLTGTRKYEALHALEDWLEARGVF